MLAEAGSTPEVLRPPSTNAYKLTIVTRNTEKVIPGTSYAHPGVRVLKYAPPIHFVPLWPNQPIEPPQATASKHRSPHSVRVRVRVRVQVGWSAPGAIANPPQNMYLVLYTWYSSSTTFHRRRISNSRTPVRI